MPLVATWSPAVHSLRAVLVVAVIGSCYVPAAGPPPPEETVAGRMVWLNASQVPREYLDLSSAPYIGPYYILVSVSGHYCAVPDAVYVAVRDNDRWACAWRPPRPSGIRVRPTALETPENRR